MPNLYPKDVLENKLFRVGLLLRAEKDLQLQQDLLQKCGEDILFFFNVWAWTNDPRLNDPHLPFTTYPYQDDFIKNTVRNIEEGVDMGAEKSRDMGFSWMLVGIQVWAWRFRGWSSLYGSYKEDYVDTSGDMDTHFERIRYVLDRLPEWMIPKDMVSKYMGVSSEELSAEISGDAGDNFGTGGRRKFVIMDEFSLWANDQKAFRKTKDVTNCRIIGGTPEGKHNVYGKIMTNHRDYKHLDIRRYTLHWTQHPLKTQEWYEEQKNKRTALDRAKELDISYEDSVTGKVYKTFSTVVKFGEYEYNPKLPLITSWDFGRDMTPIIWVQRDPSTGESYIIDAFQKSDCDIDFFVPFITGDIDMVKHLGFTYNDEEQAMIDTHRVWRKSYVDHFGDPYNGNNSNVLSKNTIQKQLAKYSIDIHFKHGTTLVDRINKTELLFRKLHIDSRLTDFIEAIEQSKYPQVKETSQATSEPVKPIHHPIYSHYRTALEYYADNEKDIVISEIPLNYTKVTPTIRSTTSDYDELFGQKSASPLRVNYNTSR